MAKAGVYLELITYKDDDTMKVSALESFTLKDNKQNLANCQADIKTRPACGGAVPKTQPTPKKFTIVIDPKQMNEAFYKIGLLPGDRLLTVDKVPVTSLNDLKKITAKSENGGRVDLEVQRKDSVLDLWYEFPKSEGTHN